MRVAPLVLVAAGGLARETIEAARASGAWEPVAALDDDPATWGTRVLGVPVTGGVDAVGDHPGASVVLCAGQGATRARLAARLARLGVGGDRFATVVHPDVQVPASCSVGRGAVVLSGVALTADVRVGDHAVLMPRVVLTHDDVLDDAVTVAAGAVLGGGVQVGEAAYLGMACSVREGVRIGAGAVVGMGAVVLRDVPAGEVWAGVPAARLAAPSDAPRDEVPSVPPPARAPAGAPVVA
ncbi:MAG: NeuD/PglB/VioB family sugar acetyltransferase [Kineosporiaceae bacterium]